jgi:hypothetical protein
MRFMNHSGKKAGMSVRRLAEIIAMNEYPCYK